MKNAMKFGREEVCAEQNHKKENILNENKIEELLFRQVERPKNITQVRVVNVYEDRYRINIWVNIFEEGIEKKKIGSSYFAHFDGNELHIKA